MPESHQAQPTVTVIIATHNYGRYLRSAIESVLNQDYENVQICVIDDGSTDNTRKILEEFKDQLDSVIHLDKPHGPSFARNTGIRTMWDFSDFFLMFDADDVLRHNKISTCLQPMLNDQNVILTFSDYTILNEENGVMSREYKTPFVYETLLRECIVHSQALVRKSALEKSGLYLENMRCAEDFHLWIRLADHGLLYHVPEDLSIVRVHKNNASNSVPKEIWNRDWQKVAELVKQKMAR